MSQRKHKKLRKVGRKLFKAEMGEGLNVLQTIVRQRPSWFPKRLWVMLYWPLFPRKYWRFIEKYIK